MASGSRRGLAALAIAASLSLTGCSAAAPTPQIIYVTPTPTPALSGTPTSIPVWLTFGQAETMRTSWTVGQRGNDRGTHAKGLKANAGRCFMSDTKGGPFDIGAETARMLLASPNPDGRSNADVVRPWINGQDPRIVRAREEQAACFGDTLKHRPARRSTNTLGCE
jgi:hypothetical protein